MTPPDETWEARFSSKMDEMQSAVDAIAAATAERDRISQEALELIREARDGADRDDSSAVRYDTFRKALRHLYWERLFVNAPQLATAAGLRGVRELIRLVGAFPSGQRCSRCGGIILATSREGRAVGNARKRQVYAGQLICRDCG